MGRDFMKELQFHINPKAQPDRCREVFSAGPLFLVGELDRALPGNRRLLKRAARVLWQEYESHGKALKRRPSADARFHACLKKANEFFAAETRRGNVSWQGNLHVAVFAVVPVSSSYSKFLFAKAGAMRLWLSRRGRRVEMGGGMDAKSQKPKVFGAMGTGKLVAGDAVYVLTRRLEDALGKAGAWRDILAAAREQELQNILKSSARRLRRASGLLVLLVFDSERRSAPPFLPLLQEFSLPHPLRLPSRLSKISLPAPSWNERLFALLTFLAILLLGFLLF